MATKKEEQEARAAEAAQARVAKIEAELEAARLKASELANRKNKAGIERAARIRKTIASKRAVIEAAQADIVRLEAEVEELDPSTPADVETDVDASTDEENDKPMALDNLPVKTSSRSKKG